MRLNVILLAVVGTILLSVSVAKTAPALVGIVLDRNESAIPGLLIRLNPVGSSNPAITTTTDRQGRFTFYGLADQKYILDVIAGHRLLYRSSIDITKQQRIVIKIDHVP